MDYSPTTRLLKNIKDRLSGLDIPIHFKLPDASVAEPFLVIGSSTSDTIKTALTGPLIEDVTVSIDIFLSNESRTDAEEVKAKALRLLGRNNRATARILVDDSVGREVYHIAIRFTETVI